MDLFAIDDSAQNRPTRARMARLVAVGGLHVPGEHVRELELGLDALCTETGFPPGEEFKWSPVRKSWEAQNLLKESRDDFNLRALALAREAGASAIVAIADTRYRFAVAGSTSHEEAVTLMFLERAQATLGRQHAIVVFDRPGGNQKSESEFLASTLEALRTGTRYSRLDKLALAVATDSRLSRLVQLADVVTSCTTSYVAGESRYSPMIFREGVLPLLREEYSCVGGRGLKLHPDYIYRNLYHWLLGDEYFVRYQGVEQSLPHRGHGYCDSPDSW